jgi:hypothetical protein
MQRNTEHNSNFTSTSAANAASITSGMSGVKCRTHIVIVKDTSSSMTSTIKKLTDSTNDVLGHLKEQFEGQEVTITVVTFASNVKVALPQTDLKNFDLIPPLSADGQTALNDAIVFVDKMIHTPSYEGRRIILTITDGDENASNPENSNDVISKIVQGYLETLSKPESSVTFIICGANQHTISKADSLGLPPTSALDFKISYVEGCANALGNMLGRVASGQDDTPSVKWDDRVKSCPSDDYYQVSDTHCGLKRTARTFSGPSDYVPSVYVDSTSTDDYNEGDESPCVLTRTATAQSYDSQYVMTRTHSGPSDYMPSEYEDDSTPSYYPSAYGFSNS